MTVRTNSSDNENVIVMAVIKTIVRNICNSDSRNIKSNSNDSNNISKYVDNINYTKLNDSNSNSNSNTSTSN